MASMRCHVKLCTIDLNGWEGLKEGY